MTDRPQCDWQGDPIPDDEPDDAIIRVWEIEPAGQYSYRCDVLWERDYYHACELAHDVLEQRMDELDPDDPDDKVSVSVRLIKVSKSEYGIATENDDD